MVLFDWTTDPAEVYITKTPDPCQHVSLFDPHHVRLLSKNSTRQSLSLVSSCLCSPRQRTSLGGTGMGTPLCNRPSSGISGSIIWNEHKVSRTGSLGLFLAPHTAVLWSQGTLDFCFFYIWLYYCQTHSLHLLKMWVSESCLQGADSSYQMALQ